jgi:signal transduction histidine kinase
MASFSRWLRVLDPELRRSISDPKAWLGLLGLTSLVVALGAVVPGTRGFFELEARTPIAWLIPTFALGIGGGIAEQRGRLGARWFGILALLDSLLLQIACWSMVTSSSMQGAAVLAGIPVLVAAYHGHAFKASMRHPQSLVTTSLALLGGVALAWGTDQLAIVAVAGTLAVGVSVLLGTVALASHDARAELDALRAAVDAQILQDKVVESNRIRESLLQVHASQHDARNTLSSVLINMQSLLRELDVHGGPNPVLAEVGADLREGLSRLQSLLGQAGRSEGLPIEQVAVASLVDEVIDEVRRRYVEVQLRRAGERIAWDLIPICGGKMALYRVLTNLVQNACEGDGYRRATLVELTVSAAEATLEIVIADDGPGFTEAQLAVMPTFRSDKPGGTGLGLYTCERLIRASGGTLTRANRAPHGALVRVTLPRGEP